MKVIQRSSGGFHRSILVRVKLYRDKALVSDRLDGPENPGKIDGAFSQQKMVVLARGGDVFKMKVMNHMFEVPDQGGGVLAHTEKMANIKVEPEDLTIQMFKEFQELSAVFDEQSRLRFDEDADFVFPGPLSDRQETFQENP